MRDEVCVEGLELGARVGVYPHEYGILQRLVIDVRVTTDLFAAGESDALEDALDYDRIAAICRSVCGRDHHRLIEKIAGDIAKEVKVGFEGRVGEVQVRVAKPGAVPDARTVAVTVRR